MSVITRHLVIRGRVQGVFYRNWMVTTARQLGLTGWVRNCMNATVEAVVEGPPEAVDRIIQLAHDGPPAAKVAEIVVQDARPGSFSGFDKRPTV
ncbi:acylphosphatase [Sphingobium cloacae]|uniref:acylphosphatase n=1 Tax=Sphingobium cloacae TaxID=120107 RepID=UPI00082EC1F1|nr:acylphosphatase [Sphingobium cloacae]